MSQDVWPIDDRPPQRILDLAGELHSCFIWKDTDQGALYWSEVYENLIKLHQQRVSQQAARRIGVKR